MKKIIFAFFCLAPITALAQDIYKVESISSEDLAGTARYVGMGGAMNVLGADLSTMSVNPAGIGLYRRSDAKMTFDIVSNLHAKKFNGVGRNRLSFDQIGFVYSNYMGDRGLKYLNFAFNYQKRKNFKSFIGVDNRAMPAELSQSITFANLGQLYWEGHHLFDKDKLLFDIPLLDAAYQSYMIDPTIDKATDKATNWIPSKADAYSYSRGHHGGVQQYDFNMGLNFNDRLFVGGNIALYNVNYNSAVVYSENLINKANPSAVNIYNMAATEEIRGTGFDFKLGVIWRPIESDPLRLGLSFVSPMWCDLTSNNSLRIISPYVPEGSTSSTTTAGFNPWEYDYVLRTPWKLNLGVASTFANCVALDLEYEYKHQGASSLRFPDDDVASSANWFDSHTDLALDRQMDKYLKGIHTFRVGIEELLTPEWSLRFGYNYVTSPFKKDAFLNLYSSVGTNYADSPSIYGVTSTDYINLGATHRGTFGVGYSGKHVTFDFAYI